MGVSELRDPNIVITLNSRILMIRTPNQGTAIFWNSQMGLGFAWLEVMSSLSSQSLALCHSLLLAQPCGLYSKAPKGVMAFLGEGLGFGG